MVCRSQRETRLSSGHHNFRPGSLESNPTREPVHLCVRGKKSERDHPRVEEYEAFRGPEPRGLQRSATAGESTSCVVEANKSQSNLPICSTTQLSNQDSLEPWNDTPPCPIGATQFDDLCSELEPDRPWHSEKELRDVLGTSNKQELLAWLRQD